MIPSENEIRRLAYQIWQEQGCPEGQQDAHWQQARAKLKSTEQPQASDNPGQKGGNETAALDQIWADARGQFAGSQADRHSDGIANAIPTKVTGYDDATLYKSDKKKAPKPGFDVRTQTGRGG